MNRRDSLVMWGTIAIVILTALPALVLEYLPMTDLPQHIALASILAHHQDAAYGFEAYYSVEWFHTPYVLPYALAVALGNIMPLAVAMRIVVFLSIVAYPLGIVALLRAANKPVWFALLAIPIVYNRAFFWGFIAFELGIGLAIAAFACLVSEHKSRARDGLFALLTLAATFCHVYGLAFLVALTGLYAVVGGWASLRTRPWNLAPILIGIALWAWKSTAQSGYGVSYSPPLGLRVQELGRSILGGYQDRSELIILGLAFAGWLALAHATLPVTRDRIRALSPIERVAYLAFVGNLIAYFVLPQSTHTAKFIHFRHAFLALALLPLCASARSLAKASFLVRALPLIATTAAILNSWFHFILFDREARTFTPIVAALPNAPKVVSLVFERNGQWMATDPYLHFVAYAQAEKGGMISMTFPAVFWNLPAVMKPDAPVPKSPTNFEWQLQFDDSAFGYFYDYAIVRMPGERIPAATKNFPFDVIVRSPPWYLYQRVR
jgi:hypothetical protein